MKSIWSKEYTISKRSGILDTLMKCSNVNAQQKSTTNGKTKTLNQNFQLISYSKIEEDSNQAHNSSNMKRKRVDNENSENESNQQQHQAELKDMLISQYGDELTNENKSIQSPTLLKNKRVRI